MKPYLYTFMVRTESSYDIFEPRLSLEPLPLFNELLSLLSDVNLTFSLDNLLPTDTTVGNTAAVGTKVIILNVVNRVHRKLCKKSVRKLTCLLKFFVKCY